jgi:two-component system, NarL family, sensor kinase
LRTLELQKLSGELMRVQDEERRRISRALHDELGQELVALKMELDMQNAGLDGKKLSAAVEITERALAKVRNISYLLHPPLLDESGLLPALHWYLGGLQKRSELRVAFDYKPAAFPRLPRDLETAVFRIIQEALTNVYRHSGSGDARIDMIQDSDRVTVRIRDFGKGIAPTASTAGVGISGMKERVKQMNGELRVTRAEPGTVVEATIPLFDASLMGIGVL